MPDLNSLPPSRSPEVSSPHPVRSADNTTDALASRMTPPSPHSAASSSLAQAATINSGIQQSESQRSSPTFSRAHGGSPQTHRPAARASRGSSIVAMNLNLNDPAVPAPGELQTLGSTAGGATSAAAAAAASSVGSAGSASSTGGILGGSTGSRRGSQHSPRTAALLRSPGLMGDPHHQRAPSLGELHQDMEQEQEAHVNRLLYQIRQQQEQLSYLQQLQVLQTQNDPASAAGVPEPGSASDRAALPSTTLANLPSHPPSATAAAAYPPFAPFAGSLGSAAYPRTRSPHPRDPLSRQSSYRSRRSSRDSPGSHPLPGLTSGATPSSIPGTLPAQPPSLAALSGFEEPPNRDEIAFYQAETQHLNRENQMLRVRIRELERQTAELQADGGPGNGSTTTTTSANAPASTSNLATTQSAADPEGKENDTPMDEAAGQMA